VELRTLAEGLDFPEGPVALADGSLLFVEIFAGTLARVTPDGTKTIVARPGGGPNGAAIGPDGRCYICNNGGFRWHVDGARRRPLMQADDYVGGRIERIDLATGVVECLYRAAGEVPLKGPNDLVFDAQGGFYFSDLGKVRAREMDRGAVYYAKADGSFITEVAFPMVTPNGVGLSPDEKTLSMSPRQRRRGCGPLRSSNPDLSRRNPGLRRMAVASSPASAGTNVSTR
jgi:gluconolactonase